jgi:hypothetical protein
MMVITVKDHHDPSGIIEKIKERSASYRVTKLYGKTIIIAWPDNHVEDLIDPSIEGIYRIKKPYPLASREWRNRSPQAHALLRVRSR